MTRQASAAGQAGEHHAKGHDDDVGDGLGSKADEPGLQQDEAKAGAKQGAEPAVANRGFAHCVLIVHGCLLRRDTSLILAGVKLAHHPSNFAANQFSLVIRD
ncbi:hypothetical protein D9M68_1001980 [compost metagenome]